MKIIENILKNFLEIPENILELTNDHIIEVENYSNLINASNLIVGHVLSAEKHPNADTLSLTTVDLGDRVEKIVCGASNVEKGQYVIVAQVGSVLPGDFHIKPTKIRGEESNGMICSLEELGINEKHIPKEYKDGIYYFKSEKEIGSKALDALKLEGFSMELGLTPNRGDLLSHLGFAYDLAAMTDQKVKLPTFKVNELAEKNDIKLNIQSDNCTIYHARKFTNVDIKESPLWLKQILIESNINPINNVVDISNYVMLEYGTPLHMFDYDKLESNEIIVRNAKNGEKVVTLDDEEKTLTDKDVVIADDKKAIAVGGVIGLKNSMIDENTKNVVLEAARFSPDQIKFTSKNLNIKTESSTRFERGVAPSRVILGLKRATELLQELANAEAYEGVQSFTRPRLETKIKIKKGEIEKILGIDIKEEQLLKFFDLYRYNVTNNKDHFVLVTPDDRPDLLILQDIVEEVARIYGLNNIENKDVYSNKLGSLTKKQKRIRDLRHSLANKGFNEVITYSLVKDENVFDFNKIGEKVSVLMPLSEDKKTLRQSLINGLLETANYNSNRQNKDLFLFEIGNLFAKDYEEVHLGILMTGTWHHSTFENNEAKVDFFVIKGILEQIFAPYGIKFDFKQTEELVNFHPFRQAHVYFNDKNIGKIGEIHPKTAKQYDLNKTYVFEINLTKLLDYNKPFKYEAPSRYPSISRDIAIVVDENLEASSILKLIEQTAKKNLNHIEIFDVYQGENIEKGKKSVAISMIFIDKNKTLLSEEVDKIMKKIVNRLQFELSAELRT